MMTGTVSNRSPRTVRGRRASTPSPSLFGAALLIAAAGAVGGAAVLRGPQTAVLALGGVGAAFGFLVFCRTLPNLFLAFLGVVLLGYAAAGKTFAYFGVAPLFIGELTLVLGIAAALASGALPAALYSGVTPLILAFSLWGAIRTLPYLDIYGMQAARDAVIWGYAAFAFTVAACVLKTRTTASVLGQYRRWLMPLVAWVPPALILTRVGFSNALVVPGTDVLMFTVKAGDSGAHLAGAAAFVLLGLHTGTETRGKRGRLPTSLFWTLWLIAFACVTAINRGGFLAVVVAMLVLAAFRPVVIGRRLVLALVAASLAFGAILATTLTLDTPSPTPETEERRQFSARQVSHNVLSILGLADAPGDLNATKEWRLEWWSTIVDYTVHGAYFWDGKGFGINLANEDGFQVANEDQAPLRSPHSAHLTVLARMGVPGLLLWTLVLLAFASSLILAHLRARRAGAVWWAKVDLWILCYWLAFLVTSTFDVALEGPMAGIWFWSLMGLGIAAVQFQRIELSRAPRRQEA